MTHRCSTFWNVLCWYHKMPKNLIRFHNRAVEIKGVKENVMLQTERKPTGVFFGLFSLPVALLFPSLLANILSFASVLVPQSTITIVIMADSYFLVPFVDVQERWFALCCENMKWRGKCRASSNGPYMFFFPLSPFVRGWRKAYYFQAISRHL